MVSKTRQNSSELWYCYLDHGFFEWCHLIENPLERSSSMIEVCNGDKEGTIYDALEEEEVCKYKDKLGFRV